MKRQQRLEAKPIQNEIDFDEKNNKLRILSAFSCCHVYNIHFAINKMQTPKIDKRKKFIC